jgi:CubicO group peptidase (beta-lactamase class C family)
MLKTPHALLLSILASLALRASAIADPPASLDDLLEPIRKKHDIPALAAAVVRGDQTLALGATGFRQANTKHRVSPDDRFHLGSCTKSITATLCALLVDEGKLRWDSTIGEVFTDFSPKIHPTFRTATLQQLLCHRAGLPEDRKPDLVIFPQLMALQGDMLAARRELIRLVMSRPPAHDVGEKYDYANYGFSIAGAMCEAVTGEPYESLITRRLFEPLGMKTAGFGAPGSPEKIDQPRGHLKMLTWYSPVAPGPGIAADNPPVIAPAGTVHCSIGDWAKYAGLHLSAARGRPRLLKADTFQTLHSDPYKQDYAFGWGMIKPDWSAAKVLAHDGSNARWYAVIVIAPAEDIAILTATNAATESAQEACAAARKLLREKFLSPSTSNPSG